MVSDTDLFFIHRFVCSHLHDHPHRNYVHHIFMGNFFMEPTIFGFLGGNWWRNNNALLTTASVLANIWTSRIAQFKAGPVMLLPSRNISYGYTLCRISCVVTNTVSAIWIPVLYPWISDFLTYRFFRLMWIVPGYHSDMIVVEILECVICWVSNNCLEHEPDVVLADVLR